MYAYTMFETSDCNNFDKNGQMKSGSSTAATVVLERVRLCENFVVFWFACQPVCGGGCVFVCALPFLPFQFTR